LIARASLFIFLENANLKNIFNRSYASQLLGGGHMIRNMGKELKKGLHDFIIAERLWLLVQPIEIINVMIPIRHMKGDVFGHF